MKPAEVFEAVGVEFGQGGRPDGDQPPKAVEQVPDGGRQIRLYCGRGRIRDMQVMVPHSIGELPDGARKGFDRVLLDRGIQLIGVPVGVHGLQASCEDQCPDCVASDGRRNHSLTAAGPGGLPGQADRGRVP